MRDYFVNEGNRIGGQEPQATGTQTKITASVAVTKGMVIEMTGSFTVGPAGDEAVDAVGIAANDAGIGETVVIETEGFVKLETTGAVTAGNRVVAAGAGKVKAKAAGAGNVIGIALNTLGAAGTAYVKLSIQ